AFRTNAASTARRSLTNATLPSARTTPSTMAPSLQRELGQFVLIVFACSARLDGQRLVLQLRKLCKIHQPQTAPFRVKQDRTGGHALGVGCRLPKIQLAELRQHGALDRAGHRRRLLLV